MLRVNKKNQKIEKYILNITSFAMEISSEISLHVLSDVGQLNIVVLDSPSKFKKIYVEHSSQHLLGVQCTWSSIRLGSLAART